MQKGTKHPKVYGGGEEEGSQGGMVMGCSDSSGCCKGALPGAILQLRGAVSRAGTVFPT